MAEKMTKQRAFIIMEAYNKWRTSPGTFYPHSRSKTDEAFNVIMQYAKAKMIEEGILIEKEKVCQDGEE